MLPQVGTSGGTPSPRKLSAASEMIADTMAKVPMTLADWNSLGTICKQ
jgi:hypothetical protein